MKSSRCCSARARRSSRCPGPCRRLRALLREGPRAAAGVMITASHKPAPRTTATSSTRVTGRRSFRPTTRSSSVTLEAPGPAILANRSASGHFLVAPELLDEYREHFVERFRVEGGSDLGITYTPLHGVGGETMMKLFADAGYSHVTPVAKQFRPDGVPDVGVSQPRRAGRARSGDRHGRRSPVRR